MLAIKKIKITNASRVMREIWIQRRISRIDIAKRMTYIDLSSDPGYMDQYMSALFLPHTDNSLFPSVKI